MDVSRQDVLCTRQLHDVNCIMSQCPLVFFSFHHFSFLQNCILLTTVAVFNFR